jgi:phage-related tail protein
MNDQISFGSVNGPVQTGSGVQNVAGRDQFFAHGDQNMAGRDLTITPLDEGTRAALAIVQRAAEGMRLTQDERQSVESDLAAIEACAQSTRPDARSLGDRLERLTSTIKATGELASEGSSLVDAITKLARWIGPAAAGVLALL